ncbi:polyprenyl synthetase family protein [Jeotgalibaca arthritidis]|uniref:Farnesyl diphosphate synthase n=1 Tax=Jeotgalibaca arthritidis TaxID=1868794 RepID=A0A6G7KCR3_9LACT|nr:farnesyl diphosphate synthase [Jeotgalibaca arthritidis]QII83001.1 polyprenyl synthetase family protein [Jeotgalibaca arthritidis]
MKKELLLVEEMASFENYLIEAVKKYAHTSEELLEAMTYSLSTGGKRFRPLLLLAAVKLGKGSMIDAFPVAAALEWIHTYSLIHDDLPAMDNDDYRRGKLTTHKAFSEATAILAGDALLTAAFNIILDQEDIPANKRVQLAKSLGEASGANGMVAGQMADIQGESASLTFDDVVAIHKKKTGALIEFAVLAGSLIADMSVNASVSLHKYAEHLGLAYQIHNDLKDVVLTEDESGKQANRDQELGKNTYPSLLGLEGAIQKLDDEIAEAEKQIELIRQSDDTKLNLALLDVFIELLEFVKLDQGV